jgi:D-tagatose-1,6-bisphosphate aldolase subunit GatZ/KbaZ
MTPTEAFRRARDTLLDAMRKDPSHWAKYYHSAGHDLDLQLQYSLSDRSRYYWPVAEVVDAMSRLSASFEGAAPPLPLLKQYLPAAYAAARRGELRLSMQSLVIHHIRGVLAGYATACDQKK